MKAIEGMQPQLIAMERRLGITQSMKQIISNPDKLNQNYLIARILKRLDDGQPLVKVARKMKARAVVHSGN